MKNEVIEDSNKEICLYGAKLLISSGFTFITIMLIGILTDNLCESIIFVLGFYFLKRKCGGFHASTYLRCYLSSVLLYLISVFTKIVFGGFLKLGLGFLFIMTSFVIIIKFAPIISLLNPISSEEIKESKDFCIKAMLVNLIVVLICFSGGLHDIAYMICICCFEISILMILELVRRKKGGVKLEY